MVKGEGITTYKDFEALAPNKKLYVFFAKDGFEGVCCWAHEGLQYCGRYVEERGDECVLEFGVVVLGAGRVGFG